MNKKLIAEICRMKELAGITSNSVKNLSEKYLTRAQILQQSDSNMDMEEISSPEITNLEITDSPEIVNSDIDSAEEIQANADNLYPGRKYYGMYAGEHMMEDENVISNMNENDELLIDNRLFF